MHPQPMNRTLPLLLVALAGLCATGCSPGVKLVGVWQVDSDKLRAKVESEAGGNPLATLAAGMLSVVEAEVEFKADGTYVGTAKALGQSSSSKGAWRYVKSEGEDMVIAVKGEKDSAEREVKVHFVDWDHIEMAAPIGTQQVTGSGTFPFKRMKQQ
jgi:hypothetical protein